MAHVQHYKRQDVKRVLRESCRLNKFYKNDVDLSRSKNNGFVFSENPNEIIEKLDKRVLEIMGDRKVQSQTNVLSNWVITFPKNECPNWTEQEQILFFNECIDFIIKFYGEKNFLAAQVHLDETTPHIHIQIVPHTISRKNGKETVSSASLFSKKHLTDFHRELELHMFNEFGIHGMIKNGRTKGNYTLDELKQRTNDELYLKHKNDEIDSKNEQLEYKIQKLEEKERELDEREQKLDLRSKNLAIISDSLEIQRLEYQKRENALNERKNALERKIKEFNSYVDAKKAELESYVTQKQEKLMTFFQNFRLTVKEPFLKLGKIFKDLVTDEYFNQRECPTYLHKMTHDIFLWNDLGKRTLDTLDTVIENGLPIKREMYDLIQNELMPNLDKLSETVKLDEIKEYYFDEDELEYY